MKKMANINSLPPIVQQTIEALKDKNVPENIRFNHMKTLENIRDCCDLAIKSYNDRQNKLKVRK